MSKHSTLWQDWATQFSNNAGWFYSQVCFFWILLNIWLGDMLGYPSKGRNSISYSSAKPFAAREHSSTHISTNLMFPIPHFFPNFSYVLFYPSIFRAEAQGMTLTRAELQLDNVFEALGAGPQGIHKAMDQNLCPGPLIVSKCIKSLGFIGVPVTTVTSHKSYENMWGFCGSWITRWSISVASNTSWPFLDWDHA